MLRQQNEVSFLIRAEILSSLQYANLELGLVRNSLLGTRGKCALGEMTESYHIGLRDYTIPTIGILIIATCKTCAIF